jgi:hypothetical protein
LDDRRDDDEAKTDAHVNRNRSCRVGIKPAAAAAGPGGEEGGREASGWEEIEEFKGP